MKDRVSTKILENGAIRYGIYDEAGSLLRYEYIKPEDEPTQEGDALNKATLLSDATCILYQLPYTSVPDDAFAQLKLGIGNYGFALSVKFSDGTPAAGITFSGLTDVDGSPCVTDSDGQALGIAKTATPTVGVSGYLDLQPYSAQLLSTRVITPVPITLQDALDIGTISTSKTCKFSRNLLVDIHLVGAGETGLTAPVYDSLGGSYQAGTNGRSNGKAIYTESNVVAANTEYAAVIGASSSSEGAGGNSTLLGQSSASGSESLGNGTGVSPISPSFLVGGRGGSGSSKSVNNGVVQYEYPAQPGINGGGTGGTQYNYTSFSSGTNGNRPGAGGGGAAQYQEVGNYKRHTPGGRGADGVIYYKWRKA